MMKLEELLKKLHSEQGLIKKDFWYFQKDNGHVIQSFNVPCRINKDDVNFSGTAEKSIWKAEEICIDFKTNFLYGGDIINGITRPVGLVHPVKTITMTPKAGEHTYEQFIAQGWDDETLIHEGYAVIKPTPDVTVTNLDGITKYKQLSLADLHLAHLMEKTPTVPMFKNNHDYKIENKEYTVDENAIREFSNSRCIFTPIQQPSTAPDLLNQAAQLLTERGKQYDTSGQERSSAKIVAAFNTITGRDLTPGEGWLFLMLLKAVRFYSNTETPHRDSLEDLIAYAALHAEEYLNNER